MCMPTKTKINAWLLITTNSAMYCNRWFTQVFCPAAVTLNQSSTFIGCYRDGQIKSPSGICIRNGIVFHTP